MEQESNDESSRSTVARFKNALVSVSDKEGLVDFIYPLVKNGMRVVSTGGTAAELKNAGISVIELSEQTGFNEVMEGRVKSLHPYIYMPLLARSNHPEDQKILKQTGLYPFDLVVCNLYPFEEKRNQGEQNLEEWIDVGGPSLLRAAAKNFEQITVLCDPADYQQILDEGKIPSLDKRRQLAGKAFSMLSDYNSCIADWMQGKSWEKGGDLCLKGHFYRSLRYGENPNQKASWFRLKRTGLQQASCLQGKELSFNNICDLDSAVSVVREFSEPCSVAIKHNNPCGVVCSETIEKAVELSIKADPLSVFGAVVATNQPISELAAQTLCSLFLEAVIAPDYSPSSLEIFKQKKKNLRVMKWPRLMDRNLDSLKLRCIDGGLLVQEDQKIAGKWQSNWRCVQQIPGSSVQSDLLMAWKVCAHLKSNAIALVSDSQTVGLGMGQVDRISAVESAIQRWKKFHPHVQSPVLASDGFFPFPDSIEAAAEAGIKWVIQPGGSIKDRKVISRAKELSVNLILTGQRCFSH